MKLRKDHITQRAYIRDIVGNGYFYIFNKQNGKYDWCHTKNDGYIVFMYGKNNWSYNPEKNGRGTSHILTRVEKSVHSITEPPQKIDIENHKKFLDYGLQIVCRYDAPSVIDGYNQQLLNETNFDSIFNTLKINCKLYPKDHIRVMNTLPSIIHEGNIVNKIIKYKHNYLLLSDSSIYYNHSMMVYPTSANTLRCVFDKNNDKNVKIIETFEKNIHNWNEYILNSAKCYLIAHNDMITSIRDAIKNEYNSGLFSLNEWKYNL